MINNFLAFKLTFKFTKTFTRFCGLSKEGSIKKSIHTCIYYIYIYIYIYISIKSDGKKEQILSIFYVTKAFLLTNLQSVTKIIFLQKNYFFICYLI